ncbi:MAG TPA: hypothetical protein VLF39_03875 [Candidatus Saccharimonadales bacterium]|nr:hypothetical protein [Candidatus Saccharimonadales bacterium]
MEQFLEQIKSYVGALNKFVALHQLPEEWFNKPDHVAIKGKDGADFARLIELFRPHSFQITSVIMNKRRLASVQINGSINIGRFGEVSWVEIMEPRPEKAGKDVVGFEHAEFLFPNFDAARLILDDKKVPYEMQENPGHKWINIVINGGGQELKLNNKLLMDTVKEEIDTGKAFLL